MKLIKIIQHKKISVCCKVCPRKWLYREGFEYLGFCRKNLRTFFQSPLNIEY